MTYVRRIRTWRNQRNLCLYYFADCIALKNKLRFFPFFWIFFRALLLTCSDCFWIGSRQSKWKLLVLWCKDRDKPICMDPCFESYYTKKNFQWRTQKKTVAYHHWGTDWKTMFDLLLLLKYLKTFLWFRHQWRHCMWFCYIFLFFM